MKLGFDIWSFGSRAWVRTKLKQLPLSFVVVLVVPMIGIFSNLFFNW